MIEGAQRTWAHVLTFNSSEQTALGLFPLL